MDLELVVESQIMQCTSCSCGEFAQHLWGSPGKCCNCFHTHVPVLPQPPDLPPPPPAPPALSWFNLPMSPELRLPEQRRGHSATSVTGTGRIVFFGGNNDQQRFNDVHILDTEAEQLRFTKIPCLSELLAQIYAALDTGDDDNNAENENNMDSRIEEILRGILNGTIRIQKDVLKGKPPIPRTHHSATLVGQRLWIFGGEGNVAGRRRVLNDIHVLDLCTCTWSTPQISCPTVPLPRSAHSAVAYGNKIVLFGGHGITRTYDDVWIFDTDLLCWTSFEPTDYTPRSGYKRPRPDNENKTHKPTPRYFHTATLLTEDLMVIYGGRTEQNVLNDVAILHLRLMQWLPVKVVGNPIGRAGHSACTATELGNRIIIFGGWDGRREGVAEIGALNDVCILSITQNEEEKREEVEEERIAHWRVCEGIDGEAPKERDCHSATLVSTSSALRLYIFGGCDADFNYSGDMHILNIGAKVYAPSLYKTVLRWMLHYNKYNINMGEGHPLPETTAEDVVNRIEYETSKGSKNKGDRNRRQSLEGLRLFVE